ncbi:hypothetical protein BDV18DRAFT_132418 [Aspergillus unguis]
MQMAVNVLPDSLATKTNTTTPSMNKRLPPLADRSSLSYKLTNLSKQKLAREATAPDPDIRRCLVHFRMHCRSVEWSQQEMATKITSFEFEDDSESESEDEDHTHTEQQQQKVLESIQAAATAAAAATPAEEVAVEVAVEVPTTPTMPTKDAEPIHVHFEVVAPVSEEKEKDAGLVEMGRRRLEKAQSPSSPSTTSPSSSGFWPSPTQCIPVRIAG